MDRNTLIGLVLIGAILLGFSWFSRPSAEEIARAEQEARAAQLAQEEASSAERATALPLQPAEASPSTDSIAQDQLPLYRQRRDEQIIELKNDRIHLSLSTHGARPIEAILPAYLNNATAEGEERPPVRLFSREDIFLNLPLRTFDNQLINTSEVQFELMEQTDSTVLMRLPLTESSHLDFRYTLLPDDYRVRFQISGAHLDKILPANMSVQDIEWQQRLPQLEQSWKFEGQYSSIYYYYPTGEVDDLSTSSQSQESVKESVKWFAFKDKYFSSVLINNSSRFTDSSLEIKVEPEGSGYVRNCWMRSTFAFGPRATQQQDFTFFFGPNDYDLLRSYDEGVEESERLQLDHLVYLGINIFRVINRWLIIPVVTFLQQYIGSWGIIILLLTIFIKLLLSPFTYKGYLSQAKMRVLRPQVEEINARYPGKDQETMLKKQRETMALYSSAGASPMSGCLPMLLQMPFLIALYMYFPTSILLRGESFLWAEDLSTYDPVISWSFDIPLVSSLLGNHISLFCLLMTIVNIVYNRYMMNQSPSSSEAMPGMKWMPYMMSIMFFFMFNQNASGLSYYYFISTLITILQYFFFRFTINEQKLLSQLEENKKKPRKKSKFMQRLEEAQRLQQQQAAQRARGKR